MVAAICLAICYYLVKLSIYIPFDTAILQLAFIPGKFSHRSIKDMFYYVGVVFFVRQRHSEVQFDGEELY